jgi:hypothetical protein
MGPCRCLVVAALAAVAGVASAGTAAAQMPPYYAGVIRNDARKPVKYSVSVNDGKWVPYTLRPGERHVVSVPTARKERLPGKRYEVRVRFDNHPNDNRVKYHTQKLVMTHVGRPAAGYINNFFFTSSQQLLLNTLSIWH